LARLILLTDYGFAEVIANPLRAVAPKIDLRTVTNRAELEMALDGPGAARLVSFGSGVIVPAALLARATAGAYNFHPGPPAYPGIFPSVFALYDGARSFGVTLHEMAARVDSGPIIAVDEFDVPNTWDRLALDTASFNALMGQFVRMAPHLTNLAQPLLRTQLTWGTQHRTRKDFEALCRLPDNATAEEFSRRYRAVGEGPDHALTFTRFGRTFRLESAPAANVVRGGQPAR
jgi:methionyl-tRNA formyltransferase